MTFEFFAMVSLPPRPPLPPHSRGKEPSIKEEIAVLILLSVKCWLKLFFKAFNIFFIVQFLYYFLYRYVLKFLRKNSEFLRENSGRTQTHRFSRCPRLSKRKARTGDFKFSALLAKFIRWLLWLVTHEPSFSATNV